MAIRAEENKGTVKKSLPGPREIHDKSVSLSLAEGIYLKKYAPPR
jgi:hypothetical protein